MKINATIPIRTFAGIAAVIGWFAVVMQFYLLLLNRVAPVGETIIRFFSFFTILSNITVAFVFTSLFVSLNTGICRFCARATTFSAVTVYIMVVGTVYNLVLRYFWTPDGLQRIVDELLHTVIPVCCLLFWLLFVPKKALRWKNSLPWLIFPMIYSVFLVIRGNFSGFYPYPFINVTDLGYEKAMTNGIILLAVFLFFSLLLIGIAKLLNLTDKKNIA